MKQIIPISSLSLTILLISALHYLTPIESAVLHQIYQRLYYIPIILAALRFGVRGGLGAALLASVSYAPHIVLHWEHQNYDYALNQYAEIALFFVIGVALFIALALMAVPFMIAVNNPDPEKVSAYECGFNAFDDARMKFDVRFYLVSLLFIIFDLEIAFLFPWAVAFKEIGAFGFWSMMVFLGVLTIGFIYEWRKGALEWD